jgi:hypothetical protein
MPWVSDVQASIEQNSATLVSPAPRLGLLCVGLLPVLLLGVIAIEALGKSPYLIVATLVAVAVAAALVACARSFRTRFDGAAQQATVERLCVCGNSIHHYPFAAIDALAVTEDCIVELHLRDGTIERLSYAHETFPQLDKMINAVCVATGIAKGSPNVARAPFEDRDGVLSERAMGLYVEGRFAILATSAQLLSFRWLMEIVFNRERREMTVVRTTPFRHTRQLIPLQAVASIGLDGAPDRETGAYTYRGVIRLQDGRSIQFYGYTTVYSRYDRILSKVRDLTGLAKEDHIVRPEDYRSQYRPPA